MPFTSKQWGISVSTKIPMKIETILKLFLLLSFALIATIVCINFLKKKYVSFNERKKELEGYKLHNQELKKRSLEYSPNGKKVAYFHNKFIVDIKEIGDDDFASLIVESDGKTKVLFQGNHRLGYFEWLNNEQIKLYVGCGSSCLINYIIDVETGKYEESVEKIFSFDE